MHLALRRAAAQDVLGGSDLVGDGFLRDRLLGCGSVSLLDGGLLRGWFLGGGLLVDVRSHRRSSVVSVSGSNGTWSLFAAAPFLVGSVFGAAAGVFLLASPSWQPEQHWIRVLLSSGDGAGFDRRSYFRWTRSRFTSAYSRFICPRICLNVFQHNTLKSEWKN